MPRAGSIQIERIAGKDVYTFTQAGLLELKNLAEVGTPIGELAAFFQVSETWLRGEMRKNEVAKELFEMADAEGRRDLRKAAHDAAKAGDTKMLGFLLERRLGMRKEVEHTHRHTHNVVGTLPDYKLGSSDWLDKFAPADRPKEITADYEDVPDGRDGSQPGHGSADHRAGDVPEGAGGQDGPGSDDFTYDAREDRD